jgi:hypothetical protein
MLPYIIPAWSKVDESLESMLPFQTPPSPAEAFVSMAGHEPEPMQSSKLGSLSLKATCKVTLFSVTLQRKRHDNSRRETHPQLRRIATRAHQCQAHARVMKPSPANKENNPNKYLSPLGAAANHHLPRKCSRASTSAALVMWHSCLSPSPTWRS